MTAKEPVKVDILDEHQITTYPKLNQPEITVIVTYHLEGYPPRSIFVPGAGYTPKVRDDAIRADIEKLKARKPTSVTL